ncbi:MAG: iron chelate uptake ABC transporter family permease subunit, partial [Alistipes sp.]|nr:iron chelate uptake ABC transporter family permease subunit [Alistipes sp.]
MLTEEEKNDGMVGRIIPINLEEQMKSAYIDYSMSVIVSRALPDVRDGLKPVHRRILYDMSAELNLYSDKPTRKSARIVGDVLGKFHPHGDSSVYEAMVRMAQEWAMRYPLVEGQGNFGSMDGDKAAAMRYTEARMQKITDEVMADIEKETIDWTTNFDDTLKEPTVLPTKIPLLLVKAGRAKGKRVLGLILAGIMVSSLISSGTSLIKLVADPEDQLPAITYWLMGSLNGTAPKDVWFALMPMAAGLLPLFLLRWRINILTLGDEEARTMGVNARLLRATV